MSAFTYINGVTDYTQNNIVVKIVRTRIASFAGCLKNHFKRMLTYLNEIPLSEYTRLERHFFGG